MSNTYFQFTRVDSFLDDMNRKDCFDTEEMDGVNKNFKLVLASSCPTDIEDCLDDFGTLNDKVDIIDTIGDNDGEVALLWSKGINGERTLSIKDTSVTYSFADEITYLKAVFLVSYANGTGYVLAYSINNAQLEIQDDTLILPLDGMIWDIRYVGSDSV